MSLEAGSKLGSYEVLALIGKGGMGEVYSANDLKLGRTVAIKVLKEDLASDPERLRRFEQEARAASSLNHPNIVTIHDIGEHDGICYIAMENVEGTTLREILRDGPLEDDRLIRYATQMAEGLAKAHAAGIVHRDLKPENIVVSEDDYVKILDFGLAKLYAVSDVDSQLATLDIQSSPGAILGTIGYMSPEQVKGEPSDFRSDQFSLGAILYEMATGRRAFQAGTPAETLAAILHAEPRLDGQWSDIVARCLSKIAAGRWQSTKDLVAALSGACKEAQTGSGEPSIVVLPFSNMSADPDQEYFCDGMTEEIINALARLEGLHVVARTSAFQFKGRALDLREVGSRLGVKSVLEGSVRKAGDRLRVTSQLINVSDGYHLWSERFDRTLDDVFAIQEEIAQAIAGQLQVRLIGRAATPLIRRRARNAEVYELSVKGRAHLWSTTPKALGRSEECFRLAIEKEPEYAPPHAGLALACVLRAVFDLGSSRELVRRAKEEAQRAIQLDPTVGDAHYALGQVCQSFEWDFGAAKRAFESELDVNPGNAEARAMLAALHLDHGEGDAAVRHAHQAVERDPLSDMARHVFAYVLLATGRPEEAVAQARVGVDLSHGFSNAHQTLGLGLSLTGRHDEAVDVLREANRLLPNSINRSLLGWVCARAGLRDEAIRIADDLERECEEGGGRAIAVAQSFIELGDPDRVFRWLQRAYDDRDGVLCYIKSWPTWVSLGSDPRFQDLLRRMNFPHPS